MIIFQKGLEMFHFLFSVFRSQLSKVIYKASCWECKDFYIGKTKRRLHDAQSEEYDTVLPSNISPGSFIQMGSDNDDSNEETIDGK